MGKDNKEFEITKKDMVSLIYRMKNRVLKDDMPIERRLILDAQIAAIVTVIDPTGEYKEECETKSHISALMEKIADVKYDFYKLDHKIKIMARHDNLRWLSISSAIAALVIALIAVIWR